MGLFLRKKAFLLIHGFGGEIEEVESTASYFKENSNIYVHTFYLKGHDADILPHVSYQEWVKSAEDELLKLRKSYDDIYVLGFSMGGVIASHLAAKYRIKKLVLVSPAFDYLEVNQFGKDIITKIKGNYIENVEELYKETFHKLKRVPFTVVIEFVKLVSEYKYSIRYVKCPTLIIQGSIDELVPLTSSKFAYDEINSAIKHLDIVEDVRHRALMSDKKDQINEKIYQFIIGGKIND